MPKLSKDYRLGAEKVAEFDKHIYLAMKRLTAGIAREIVDTSKTAGEGMVPTHRPVLREERARRDRHCQSTPRVEAAHPDCGIFNVRKSGKIIIRLIMQRFRCNTQTKHVIMKKN